MPIPSFAEAFGEMKYHEGREEGRDEGRVQMVAAMLRHRFGPDDRITAVARRLAALDAEEFYGLCDQAKALDDLVTD